MRDPEGVNSPFTPNFTITHQMTADITQIERARGFLEADWLQEMGKRALFLEAHHITMGCCYKESGFPPTRE